MPTQFTSKVNGLGYYSSEVERRGGRPSIDKIGLKAKKEPCRSESTRLWGGREDLVDGAAFACRVGSPCICFDLLLDRSREVDAPGPFLGYDGMLSSLLVGIAGCILKAVVIFVTEATVDEGIIHCLLLSLIGQRNKFISTPMKRLFIFSSGWINYHMLKNK